MATGAIAATVASVMGGLGLVLGATQVPAPAVHLAQLGLAGGAAFLFDEAAAELTAVAPPPRWLRRGRAAGCGLVVLAGTWAVVVLASPGGSAGMLTVETVVLVVLALAASSVSIGRGEPEPGALVAPGLVLAGLGAWLAGSALGHPVFLSDATGVGAGGLVIAWGVLGAGSAVVVLVTARDPAAPSLRRRPSWPHHPPQRSWSTRQPQESRRE